MKIQDLPYQPEYFNRYFTLLDDASLLTCLQNSIDELNHLPVEKYIQLGDEVYAPGKWTIKSIFQHIIDTTRIFTYRALAFARQDPHTPHSFDENDYVIHANANNRDLKEMIAELKIVNQSFKMMYESFHHEMLLKEGLSFKGKYTVASIGFIIPGHQRHHLKIIEERYFPLLNS